MKSTIRTVEQFFLGIIVAIVISPGDAMAQNQSVLPQFSPRVEAILAKVQAEAAARVTPLPRPATNPFTDVFGPQLAPPEIAERLRDAPSPHQQAPVQPVVSHTPVSSVQDEAQKIEQLPGAHLSEDTKPPEQDLYKHFSEITPGTLIKEIRGCLKINRDEESVPQFKIYFNGMETVNNDNGFFSFPFSQESLEKYSIIICNKIKHTFGHRNTVNSFGLIPDMNYKYFRFKRSANGSGSWEQQEKDLTKHNLQIPSNAIVITINPAYFERLDEKWPANFGPGVLKLPRIVLKDSHRAKIERKGVKSLLHGLDMSPFHTNVSFASKDLNNGKGEALVNIEK